MGDDDSHGVEISIVGGVRKMVRDPTPRRFFFFSFFFFFFISCVHCFYVQEASSSASYGKNKTYKSKTKHKKPTNIVHAILKSRHNNRLSLTNK